MQRTILDQLRSNNPFDCADRLILKFERIKNAVRYSTSNALKSEPVRLKVFDLTRMDNDTNSLPVSEGINENINELTRCISNINTLADDFITEMRENAYSVPNGARRNAYAVDCCNFIDSCLNAQRYLFDAGEVLQEEGHKLIKERKNLLLNLGYEFKIGHVVTAFEEYYPNTLTLERESAKQYDELMQLQGEMSSEDFFAFLERQNQAEPLSENQKPKVVGTDEPLTAFQRLLFIRLLQQEGLFPQKPPGTDNAPELKAIGLLTGLDYDNQIKGGKGANSRVNLFLDNLNRNQLSSEQARAKLRDLNEVEKVAKLLNVTSVVALIGNYCKALKGIIED